jgi:NAD(P)-dependent dehydrogenase (short-subunit alcohol dehydrogenase family)
MLIPERAPEKINASSALDTLTLNLLAPMLFAKHFTKFLLPKKRTATTSTATSGQTNNNNSSSSQMGSSVLPPVAGLNPNISILAFMSARVGSISDNRSGGWYSYRASKAGLNQLVKSVDLYLKMRRGVGGSGSGSGGAACVGLHPGTVKTELSREFWAGVEAEGKLFEPGFAAERLLAVLEGLNGGMGGRCWDWKGEEIVP